MTCRVANRALLVRPRLFRFRDRRATVGGQEVVPTHPGRGHTAAVWYLRRRAGLFTEGSCHDIDR